MGSSSRNIERAIGLWICISQRYVKRPRLHSKAYGGFGFITQPLGSYLTGMLAPDNKIYDVGLGCFARGIPMLEVG